MRKRHSVMRAIYFPHLVSRRGSQFMKKLVLLVVAGMACLPVVTAGAMAQETGKTAVAVGPQYDTTHVYVATEKDMDALVTSLVATFGGTAGKRGVADVTPTPSSTLSQVVLTPVGLFSIFAYQTAVPSGFGDERTGYLVADMDEAMKAARAAGAVVIVAPFKDPIGIDAILEWPGGVRMQLYWHFKAGTSPPLETIPENRVYVSPERADEFLRDWVGFSGGRVVEDARQADGGEIGRPRETYRRIRITSLFGKMQVMVRNEQLRYPFGHETTGYEVRDLDAALKKAAAAGAKVLSAPYDGGGRRSAIVEFPGRYIAEIHSANAGDASAK
jgi:predicted enzyme related to lactoylglutathione lyase